MKVFSYDVLNKNDGKISIVYKEGDMPVIQYMAEDELNAFVIVQKLCAAGIDEKLLEEYGQLQYEIGYDRGYECGYECGYDNGSYS